MNASGLIDAVDPRIWQAVIAGGVVALGWIVNGARERAEARRQRRSRTRDVHKALFAEIQNTLSVFYGEGRAEQDAAELIARMRADPDFVPFVPHEVHDRVFVALISDIEVLPRQTIDAIVAFYSYISAVMALAQDMRGRGYARLPADRRIALYEDFMAMRLRAFAMGQYVLKLIRIYADSGPEAAERFAAKSGAGKRRMPISNPVADRIDPEGPGSA